ncbi:hypothetical protein [Glutamicibacter sp. AOP5-A2-18]|uniref:hypothetical protein n=1 Tax=Glutamicibacter sp. AOP5-A2-18 TaxID=3457656 RepID=UPI0040345F74
MTERELDASLAWLSRINGFTDEYLAQWSRDQWRAWAISMRAGGRGLPHPILPGWMNDYLPEYWGKDWTNGPEMAHLWSTDANWFGLAQSHDDFEAVINECVDSANPSLDSIRDAWNHAHELEGMRPLLNLDLVPGKPGGVPVRGMIRGFYVVGQFSPKQRELFAALVPETPAKDNSWTEETPLGLLEVAEMDVQHELVWLLSDPAKPLEMIAFEWF